MVISPVKLHIFLIYNLTWGYRGGGGEIGTLGDITLELLFYVLWLRRPPWIQIPMEKSTEIYIHCPNSDDGPLHVHETAFQRSANLILSVVLKVYYSYRMERKGWVICSILHSQLVDWALIPFLLVFPGYHTISDS